MQVRARAAMAGYLLRRWNALKKPQLATVDVLGSSNAARSASTSVDLPRSFGP